MPVTDIGPLWTTVGPDWTGLSSLRRVDALDRLAPAAEGSDGGLADLWALVTPANAEAAANRRYNAVAGSPLGSFVPANAAWFQVVIRLLAAAAGAALPWQLGRLRPRAQPQPGRTTRA